MLKGFRTFKLFYSSPTKFGITSNGIVIPMLDHFLPALLRLFRNILHKSGELLPGLSLVPGEVTQLTILIDQPGLIEVLNGLLPLPDVDFKIGQT